jgi:hypothetical protein
MTHNDDTYDELVEALLRKCGREQETAKQQKKESIGAELRAETWSRHFSADLMASCCGGEVREAGRAYM